MDAPETGGRCSCAAFIVPGETHVCFYTLAVESLNRIDGSLTRLTEAIAPLGRLAGFALLVAFRMPEVISAVSDLFDEDEKRSRP